MLVLLGVVGIVDDHEHVYGECPFARKCLLRVLEPSSDIVGLSDRIWSHGVHPSKDLVIFKLFLMSTTCESTIIVIGFIWPLGRRSMLHDKDAMQWGVYEISMHMASTHGYGGHMGMGIWCWVDLGL